MSIKRLVFFLTERCNFNCTYCSQKKSEEDLPIQDIRKAIDFFFDPHSQPIQIGFYGGEPVLRFSQIVNTVEYIKHRYPKRPVQYTLSSNGSLLDKEILSFFDEHRFTLGISYDGIGQDILRKNGSGAVISKLIDQFHNYRNISPNVSTVIAAKAVDSLYETIIDLLKTAIPNIHLNVDRIHPWNQDELNRFSDQIRLVQELLFQHWHDTRKVPVTNFRQFPYPVTSYTCGAGRRSVSIAVDGTLWGCITAAAVGRQTGELSAYSYGTIDEFQKSSEAIRRRINHRYRQLKIERMKNDTYLCRDCPDLHFCRQCPLEAVGAGNPLGIIPTWFCSITNIFHRSIQNFWDKRFQFTADWSPDLYS